MQFILCNSLLVKEREWIHSSRRITLNETTQVQYIQVTIHGKSAYTIKNPFQLLF